MPRATFRVERDPLGEVRVPADAYYGGQTARAVENFPISGLTAPPALVTATILIKKAAAEANRTLGRLSPSSRPPIVRAADEVLDGAVPRSVRRRRLPGGRRHLAQHERERGAGQSRRRDPRRAPWHLHARAPQRSRQHGTVDQRRVSDGDAAGDPLRCCAISLAAARALSNGLAEEEPPIFARFSRPAARTCRTPCRSRSARSSAATRRTSRMRPTRSSGQPRSSTN